MYRTVLKPTGEITRTENSLNQHIKLKHREFWEQLKLNNEPKEEEVVKNMDDKIEIKPDSQLKEEDIVRLNN